MRAFQEAAADYCRLRRPFGVVVFDAPAAGLATAQRKAIHQHRAPAVLCRCGVDFLASQPGGCAGVVQRQLLAVRAPGTVGHKQRMGRLEPLFQHSSPPARRRARCAAWKGSAAHCPAPAAAANLPPSSAGGHAKNGKVGFDKIQPFGRRLGRVFGGLHAHRDRALRRRRLFFSLAIKCPSPPSAGQMRRACSAWMSGAVRGHGFPLRGGRSRRHSGHRG